jgi:hypothetical protein
VLALHPPVPGPIVRPFAYAGSPFARGLHRGVDLAVAPGARVSAPCAGRVAYAGGYGVTLHCGRYRVTLLPVAPGVGAGARARVGATVGRAQERTLHLGVRRAGDAFGYVDPAPLLRRARPAPPVMRGPRAKRAPPRRAPAPRAAPALHAAPARATAPARAAPLAPWPAWAGLTLALAGVVRWRGIRRRNRVAPCTAGQQLRVPGR